ncbi:hypothetical protein Y032_0241g3387 [Ancylostoma ceylanicum]|uniref:Uncharacterized protein n=2 Tax=Ancylostoma ceylanicum TaxID=53326 RepID=A0A016SDP7_9BILA|nr:hypothetical protein Y032_0241g3387 [Ancylostoma ceylanicum]
MKICENSFVTMRLRLCTVPSLHCLHSARFKLIRLHGKLRQGCSPSSVLQQMGVFHVKKTKYDAEWNYDSTLKWMKRSWNELKRLCENTSVDYQRYGPPDYPYLEQQISVCVFGVTSDYAERALKMDNLLNAFGDRERRFAASVRKRLEEVAGGNCIDVQMVPIYVLPEERIGQIDAPSARILGLSYNSNFQELFN